jgi:hypothetical protein
MPETVKFIIPAGVVSFHWSGPGAIKVHTQFRSKNEAIEVFARLREEMDLILDTLSMNLDAIDTFGESSSTRHDTERPYSPPGSGFAGLLEDVQKDPRLVARQRPTSGSGELNYSKLPPRAALSAAQKLAEDQVAAYARAQGRGGTHPPENGIIEDIQLPQAKRVEMKADVKPPTHEEALAEARKFIDEQRKAMGLAPMKTDEVKPATSTEGPSVEQMLPPPPPADSDAAIAEDLSKSS